VVKAVSGTSSEAISGHVSDEPRRQRGSMYDQTADLGHPGDQDTEASRRRCAYLLHLRQIRKRELQINHFHVPLRVHRARDMDNVVVLEAADHLHESST